MDKNREVRRRGVIGSRHVAATRRSRTSGFKYFPVCNDDGDDMAENNLNSRLQDSSKKHSGRVSPSLQESDSCKETESSQNKRKRPDSQEPQNHRPIIPTVEDMNDTSEDAGTARSEDDDDMPPPRVPHRPLKLKLHGKPPKNLSPIDPAAVPRKLRTAVIKRHLESTLPPVVADNPKQHLPNDAPAKLAATNSIVLASNAALKPGRKMKPNNLKPPTAKLPKRSPTKVSKTEVEVAETLYDLSRMFMHREMSSVPEAKAEPLLQMIATENAVAVTDRQPGLRSSTAAAGSSSSTHTLERLGASKNKQPRVSSNTKDEGQPVAACLASVAEPCLSGSSLGAAMESADAEEAVCLNLEKGQSQMDPIANLLTEALVSSMIDPTAGLPSTNLEKNPETNEEKRQRTEVGSPALVEFTSTSVSAEKLTVGNLVDSINVDDKDGGIVENLEASRTSAKLETRNRLLQLTPLEGAHYGKVKIDLMVPPKLGGKADDTMDSSMANGREREEVDLSTISAIEVTLLEKERNKEMFKNMDIDKENKQPVKMMEHDQRSDWKLAADNVIFRERNNKRDGLKDRGKQEVAKQTPKGAGKNVKADSRTQRVDGNASAALVTATTSSSLKSTLFPISVGMAGWPAGYCSPVAAAAAVASSWPTPARMTGTSSVENDTTSPQLSLPFFQTQQSRKRCAMHIYITRFIDCQQQVKCNPLWAVAYGNPACLYGSRAYNLNNPMCSTDSVFGNRAESGLVGTSVASGPGPGSRSCELVLGCMKEKVLEDSPLTTANVHWERDGPASPSADAKPLSQQQTQVAQKKPTISWENGPAFGFPFNQSPAGSVSGSGAETSNTAGSNTLVTAAMFARGSSASTNSSSIGDAVVDSGNGLSDGSVANAAVVQAQLLHSVFQQSTFPFSISSGHFGSTYSGHLFSQQAPHFFGNPFYDPRMVSQQLASDSSASDSQKQQQKHSQGVCSFPSLRTHQQQHQQVWTSFQDTQSPAGAGLQPPICPNEKDIVAGIMPSAKMALPMVDRNICGQSFPSVHVPSMNSQSLVLAAVTPGLPGHSQDFTLMPAFGGKQANKEKQQEPQAHLQSQHQLTAQVQQQKQHLATQYNVTSAALQIGLKEIGSNTSQSVSSISMNRESVSPDLLGLPAITSIMAPAQGQIIQGIVDLARGHGHPQNSAHNQPISGQSHQSSMLTGQDQKKQHQSHAQKQREVSSRLEETGIHINEGNYADSNQSNVSRPDLKASLDVQVSRTNGPPRITKNATAPSNLLMPSSQGGSSVSVSISIPSQQPSQSYKQQMVLTKDAARLNLSASAELTSITFPNATLAHAAIFGKFPPAQRLPSPGQNESGTNQGVTHVYAQELPHLKVAQKALPAISGIPPHDILAAMAKTQGQQLNEPHVMNAVPIARICEAASLSSPSVTTSLLPLSPVSKSGSAALAKNSVCVKDSYLSQQKSSLAATSGKGSTTTTNVASILGPSPSKTLQVQMNQNQYNTYQNQQQQHQRSAVSQQYPSNQKQVHQLLQQPLPQQQHLQIGQHHLVQQLPQYEIQIQSQLHSQAMPQQRILYQQNMSQKLEQPCRQMTSKFQQLGSIQQQDHKHLQAVLPTSFGDLSHTSGIANATTSGVMTPAQSVGETSMTCADSERSINVRTALLHSLNGSTSSQQQSSNSNTVCSPGSNPLSQPISNSGIVGKICETTGQ